MSKSKLETKEMFPKRGERQKIDFESSWPKRGEIWIAKTEKVIEYSKDYRPVLIISDNLQNEFFKSITVAPITSKRTDEIQPFEVHIKSSETGLEKDSKILLNLPFFLNKELRLVKRIGFANEEVMKRVKEALNFAFNW